jgi:dTMP kinase
MVSLELPMESLGRFIVFEGIDGCGKSTQLQRLYPWLCQWLREQSGATFPTVLQTREPGATELGQHLRSLLLNYPWQTSPPVTTAELLLYAADRAQHVEQVLKPHLAQGGWILCDRHVDSTVAYQGYGRGVKVDLIHALNHIATAGLVSDLTLWIDVPVTVAQQRLQQRWQSATSGHPPRADRMEANQEAFHHRVRQGFETLAQLEPQRVVRVNGDQDPHRVALEIQEIIKKRLNCFPQKTGEPNSGKPD